MATIAENVARVRDDIAAACRSAGRDPASVRLIAVTKSVGPEALPALAAQGILDFGENRVEHLAMMATGAPPGARFHHIGRLQSRQFPELTTHAAVVHGLAQADHARRLAAVHHASRLPVFLQVNVACEASKAGVAPDQLGALLDVARALVALEVVGLMTMAPPRGEGVDDESILACFTSLRELAQKHGLARLSMGMSDDFPLAIRAGATDLRIGSRLFT